MEIETRRWLRVRVNQRDEELYVLTATLVVDEGFESRARRRHVHLHAQCLDNQLLGVWNGDRWRSCSSKGLNGHLVLAGVLATDFECVADPRIRLRGKSYIHLYEAHEREAARKAL
jgi:hypothetical protein